MSPGVTFKKRPMIAFALLAIVGLGLSWNSVGKGAPHKAIEIKG